MLEAPSAGAAETDRIAGRMTALRGILEDQGIAVAVAPPAAPGALGARSGPVGRDARDGDRARLPGLQRAGDVL